MPWTASEAQGHTAADGHRVHLGGADALAVHGDARIHVGVVGEAVEHQVLGDGEVHAHLAYGAIAAAGVVAFRVAGGAGGVEAGAPVGLDAGGHSAQGVVVDQLVVRHPVDAVVKGMPLEPLVDLIVV